MIEPTTGRVAALLLNRMEKLGHTRKKLASLINRSVEHVRKLEAGEALPGPDLQERLAEVLKVDHQVLREATENDRWLKKFGKYPPVAGWKSITSPIEKVWRRLNRTQREDILCIAECMSRRNLKRTRMMREAVNQAGKGLGT
jgi:transcriptional regulator with XRE-family HTH domain